MFCSCKNPKPKTMKVLHKEFHVCAKSEGGCGLEMSEGKARVIAGRMEVRIDGKVVASAPASYNINPHSNPVNCPKCAGQCTMIKRNVHTGRLEEVDCDYCNGKGRV